MRRPFALSLGILSLSLSGFLIDCGDSSSDTPNNGTDAGGTDTGSNPTDSGGTDTGVDSGPECTTTCPRSDQTCCSGKCVDLKRDPKNCGACGTACNDTQFCNGTSCLTTQFSNLCQNAKAAVVQDGQGPDDTAGASLGTTIASCTPAVTQRTVSQYATGVLEQSTNRPILGPGETFVAGGGFYYQLGINHLKQAQRTIIDGSYDPNVTTGTGGTIRNRVTGTDVVTIPAKSLSATHDYLIFQLTVEPTSGTLCFSSYGLQSEGTAAAALYFQNTFFPALSTKTGTWYIYEWTDSDGTPGPSATDTFTFKFSN
jgi:hypothetical protein